MIPARLPSQPDGLILVFWQNQQRNKSMDKQLDNLKIDPILDPSQPASRAMPAGSSQPGTLIAFSESIVF